MAQDTSGRQKLEAWIGADKSRSRTAIARALGISQPAVSNWLRGVSRPEHVHRLAIERLCGIPAGEWETDSDRARRELLAEIPPLTGTEG